MILLTGYIIKPQAYNDKHDTAIVDKKYEEEIKAAKKIREDFVWNQKNDYTEVTEVLFPTLDSDAN